MTVNYCAQTGTLHTTKRDRNHIWQSIKLNQSECHIRTWYTASHLVGMNQSLNLNLTFIVSYLMYIYYQTVMSNNLHLKHILCVLYILSEFVTVLYLKSSRSI